MYPQRRNSNLVEQDLENEVLVYDLDKDKAFCLNDSSALVWQMCNGNTSFAEIAEKSGLPQEYVWVAIEEFQKNKLLEEAVETGLPKDRTSRRTMLFKIGATAVALPLVVGIVAPFSVQAASVGACSNPGGLAPGAVLFGGATCGATEPTCSNVCVPQGMVAGSGGCCSGVAMITGPACPNCVCSCV